MKTLTTPFIAIAFVCIGLTQSLNAQNDQQVNPTDSLTQLAISLGIQPVDIPGFIRLHSGEDQHEHSYMRVPENMAPLNIINLGFETGDFTGWTGYTGNNYYGPAFSFTGIQTGLFSTGINAPVTDNDAHHTIMDLSAGNDTTGNYPIVPPGHGSYVMRLGNSGAQLISEAIEQIWIVDSTESQFYISYATVIGIANHIYPDGAFFKYEILDSIGDTIAFRLDIDNQLPASYQFPYTNLAYQAWHYDTIDLSAYIGQSVTIRFTTAECVFGGHSAYAYIDEGSFITLNTEEKEPVAFSIFPNPSNGIFQIGLSAQNNTVQISVHDLLGKTVLSDQYTNTGTMQIDLSAEPAGIYFVSVQTDSGISTQRVFVK